MVKLVSIYTIVYRCVNTYMELSSKIFISDANYINTSTQQRHVVKRRRKYEEIPQFALAFSYVFYVLKSEHPYLTIGDDILFAEEYNKKYHKLPYLNIKHVRSFVETRNNRLIEYFKITIWSNKDENSLIRLREILETINDKLWKPRIKDDVYLTTVDIETNLRCITLNVHVKTSLLYSKRNLSRRI